MSKWSRDADELDRDISRALVVQEYHPGDISALEYLAHQSDADPVYIGEHDP